MSADRVLVDGGFCKIARTFTVGEASFHGPVVASPAALYLVLEWERNDLSAGIAHGIGGIPGALLAAVVAGFASASKRTPPLLDRAVPYGDLPVEVTSAPDWPCRAKEGTLVLYIPHDAVGPGGIRHPGGSDLLLLEVDGVQILVEYLTFRGRRVRAFLERSWPVHWGGSYRAHVEALGLTRDRKPLRLGLMLSVAVFALVVGVYAHHLITRPPRPKQTLQQAIAADNAKEIQNHQYWQTDLTKPLEPEGLPPLHCAAAQGSEHSLIALLNAGVDVNSRDSIGRTAAHCAGTQIRILNLLKARGGDLTVRDDAGNTVLHSAILQDTRSIEHVARLLPAEYLDAPNNAGQTPVILVTISKQPGHTDSLKWLLSAGARADVRDRSNKTALEHAEALARRSEQYDPDYRYRAALLRRHVGTAE